MNSLDRSLWAAVLACCTLPAWGKDPLFVAWNGGSREQTMKEKIIPRFEAMHPVSVQYVAAVSSKTLARLQAQKANPDLDVVIMDDGPIYQASEANLCAEDTPRQGPALFDVAAMRGAHAVGIGVVATGIEYNTAVFAKRGWPAPTSWKDLEDPKYKGQLGLLSISNTFGLHTLLMMSRVNGGTFQDVEPGFKALAERVVPNVQAFVESSGNMSAAFQSGEIAIAVHSDGRTVALAGQGFPVAFVAPREGAVATVVGACAVRKKQRSPYANAFIEYLLTPEVQKILAEDEGLAPVNRQTRLSPEAARTVLNGEEAMKSLVVPDWEQLNKVRPAWTRRWLREVETTARK